MTFKGALKQTPHLENAWQPGLRALRAEDRPHIKPENPRLLCGSADVDTALQAMEPNANRWDFAIGFQHDNRGREFVYWVETHTGSDGQISLVLKKLTWLKKWLAQDGGHLAGFEREFVWVSSGATFFTKGSPQVKELAQKGLRYTVTVLKIPDKHPEDRQ